VPEIGAILFGLLGVGVIVYCQVAKWKVRQSASWLPVTAEITRSEVARGSGYGRVLRYMTSGRLYVADIEYSYEVDGTEYSGDTICVGGELNTSMRSRAEERCAKYPVGVRVSAYYDPQDPSRACLERTAEGTQLFTWIGLGAILFGLLLYLGVMRSTRRHLRG